MGSLLQEWGRDLKLAFRGLIRAPGFTAVAVLTLGLAIGADAGMFAVVDAVLLRPLPYKDVDRLVVILASAPGSQMPQEFGVSNEFIVQYRESHMLESVSAYNAFTSTLRTDDRVERVLMSYPDRSIFETLGAKPIIGRLPEAGDEDRTALISETLWTTWFGRDPGVIGRSYDMAGARRTIIGVMGPDFRFPIDGTLLWISGSLQLDTRNPGNFGRPLVARMAPGVTTEALANELTTLSKRLPERFGGPPRYATLIGQHRAVVRPLREELFGSVSRPLWVLLGGVGIVLLIACANVANLFIVRTEGRRRELVLRRAVGAGRGQLIRL